jgi:F0F1-type ATP synthase alpha subunit
VILYVLNKGLFDPIPMHDMGKFERALRSFFTHRENKLLLSIDKEERLSESTIRIRTVPYLLSTIIGKN